MILLGMLLVGCKTAEPIIVCDYTPIIEYDKGYAPYLPTPFEFPSERTDAILKEYYKQRMLDYASAWLSELNYRYGLEDIIYNKTTD